MPNKTPLKDVVGGSGSFATLGSRLFARKPASVGCLLIAGPDLPTEVEFQFRGWGITVITQKREGAFSSRGLLEYEDDTFGRT
jgi:hypothetical protein